MYYYYYIYIYIIIIIYIYIDYYYYYYNIYIIIISILISIIISIIIVTYIYILLCKYFYYIYIYYYHCYIYSSYFTYIYIYTFSILCNYMKLLFSSWSNFNMRLGNETWDWGNPIWLWKIRVHLQLKGLTHGKRRRRESHWISAHPKCSRGHPGSVLINPTCYDIHSDHVNKMADCAMLW